MCVRFFPDSTIWLHAYSSNDDDVADGDVDVERDAHKDQAQDLLHVDWITAKDGLDKSTSRLQVQNFFATY